MDTTEILEEPNSSGVFERCAEITIAAHETKMSIYYGKYESTWGFANSLVTNEFGSAEVLQLDDMFYEDKNTMLDKAEYSANVMIDKFMNRDKKVKEKLRGLIAAAKEDKKAKPASFKVDMFFKNGGKPKTKTISKLEFPENVFAYAMADEKYSLDKYKKHYIMPKGYRAGSGKLYGCLVDFADLVDSMFMSRYEEERALPENEADYNGMILDLCNLTSTLSGAWLFGADEKYVHADVRYSEEDKSISSYVHVNVTNSMTGGDLFTGAELEIKSNDVCNRLEHDWYLHEDSFRYHKMGLRLNKSNKSNKSNKEDKKVKEAAKEFAHIACKAVGIPDEMIDAPVTMFDDKMKKVKKMKAEERTIRCHLANGTVVGSTTDKASTTEVFESKKGFFESEMLFFTFLSDDEGVRFVNKPQISEPENSAEFIMKYFGDVIMAREFKAICNSKDFDLTALRIKIVEEFSGIWDIDGYGRKTLEVTLAYTFSDDKLRLYYVTDGKKYSDELESFKVKDINKSIDISKFWEEGEDFELDTEFFINSKSIFDDNKKRYSMPIICTPKEKRATPFFDMLSLYENDEDFFNQNPTVFEYAKLTDMKDVHKRANASTETVNAAIKKGLKDLEDAKKARTVKTKREEPQSVAAVEVIEEFKQGELF